MRFLGSKYATNAFASGAASRTPLGERTALPRPLAGFKGPTSKEMGGEGRDGGMEGREGKGEERGGAERGKGRGGKGKEEEGREGGGRCDPPLFLTLRIQ